MTFWFAAGTTPHGARSIALTGADVTETATGCDSAPVIRVGESEPERLPAPVLPRTGSCVPDWVQDQPADRISGWVRLWVAGALTDRTSWDGVICVTYGEVTHWIEISAEEAISSRSALTLRMQSALGGHETASSRAVADSLSRPERLASDLRAAELSGDGTATTGHLIGAELAATRPYWLGRDVCVISSHSALYADALAGQGVPVFQCDPEAMLLKGLAVLARMRGFA
ncbi:MAG: 2-dehydro-3-deoxygalactonokinase [Pseudomonadota bacterium]